MSAFVSGLYLIVSILYCLLYLALLKVIDVFLWIPRRVIAQSFIAKLIAGFPRTFIVLGSIGVILSGSMTVDLVNKAVSADVVLTTGLMIGIWAFSLQVFASAVVMADQLPSSILQLQRGMNHHWVERRFAKHLSQPSDVVLLRLAVNHTLAMVPATISIAVPALFGVQSISLYLVGLLVIGYSHETLDHADVHRDIFRYGHIKSNKWRLVFMMFRFYVRHILNPVCGRIPNFYRVQHILMHHVENNGLRDIQSTLRYDRASFFAFCAFALRIAFSFSIPVDLYLYLARRRRLRPIKSLTLGVAFWYSSLALIALANLPGALAMIGIKLLSGVPIANNIFLWHGLIDPDRFENIKFNTINSMPNVAGGLFINGRHIDHHLRPAEHWNRQATSNPPKDDGIVVLVIDGAWHEFTFLKALWLKDFELLSKRYFRFAGTGEPVGADLIWKRTQPIELHKKHGFTYKTADHWLGRKVAYYMLPGTLPR